MNKKMQKLSRSWGENKVQLRSTHGSLYQSYLHEAEMMKKKQVKMEAMWASHLSEVVVQTQILNQYLHWFLSLISWMRSCNIINLCLCDMTNTSCSPLSFLPSQCISPHEVCSNPALHNSHQHCTGSARKALQGKHYIVHTFRESPLEGGCRGSSGPSACAITHVGWHISKRGSFH